MLYSVSSLIALALFQVGPGPLDGFRANYMSINMKLDYRYVVGSAATSARDEIKRGNAPVITPNPRLEIEGSWECNGSQEYYSFHSPASIIKPFKLV